MQPSVEQASASEPTTPAVEQASTNKPTTPAVEQASASEPSSRPRNLPAKLSTASEVVGLPALTAGQHGGMAWTYILECADGSYYVGSTTDLDRRISEHNLGEGAAYTRPRRRRPVSLLWSAQFDRVDDAYYLEKQLQNWSRAKRKALIDGRFGDLPALARGHCRRPVVDRTSSSDT